ncbi:uncharacterized protein NDAI_0C03800 [Naumovozyma dairenensis CBS 421]|uniref:Proline dehydrogenase n=1 Tax=Naumovozyma dairenensis (strain ATCC 10597 / BCRC 20456 / CBS 421 / NBRC 0211 / NRRL Y-12639) TaxID=1071378 RepID=G0W8C9_NAUDC|nr:hypothetical protein NDAI_0C03800 [Naumovozyma dairenensis CBS 421]CCD24040.1 hypothetical protein NDAI_0C03800 [Naumovozyma dairenensis CBS 421]
MQKFRSNQTFNYKYASTLLKRNIITKRLFCNLTTSTSTANPTSISTSTSLVSNSNLFYSTQKNSYSLAIKRFYTSSTDSSNNILTPLTTTNNTKNIRRNDKNPTVTSASFSSLPTKEIATTTLKNIDTAHQTGKIQNVDFPFNSTISNPFENILMDLDGTTTLKPTQTTNPYQSLSTPKIDLASSTSTTPSSTISKSANASLELSNDTIVNEKNTSATPTSTTKTSITKDNYNKGNIEFDNEKDWENFQFEQPNSTTYLRTLSKMELFSLTCISLVTINKLILNIVIKLFPIIPTPLIQLFVSKLYCWWVLTPKEVLKCGKNLQKRGISNMMLSLTIENSEGDKNIDTDMIINETIESIHTILKPNLIKQLEDPALTNVNDVAPGYIALKPSALIERPNEVLMNFNNIGDEYWRAQREKLIDSCCKINQIIFDLNEELLQRYPERKAPFFVCTIDAEKFELQTKGVYDLQRILMKKFNTVESKLISCVGTWQLYLRHSRKEIDKEVELAKSGGYRLGLKLVRGAYMHSEPNRKSVIHETKFDTDVNYDQIMINIIKDMKIEGENSVYGHLMVASHNYKSQMIATQLLFKNKYANDIEYAKSNVVLGQLLGMADDLTYDLIHHHGATNIVKYVPWGPPRETKDYLLRRLQENGDAVRNDNGWPLLKNILKSLFFKN